MANEPKWTAGPWRVEQDTTLIWGNCNPDDRTNYGMGYPIMECRITPCANWAKGPDADEGEANARLIAAAPDMYKALESAIEQVRAELNYLIEQGPPKEWKGDAYRLSQIVNAGDAALAKARGE